ncbi:MAG: hypothetical protein HC873_05340 [Leptolyngbyaceae cyanobacterium SL_1_1]|nr:hypothetical protein [Leptolyngbyaceae cyanobacterium SL_1_1]
MRRLRKFVLLTSAIALLSLVSISLIDSCTVTVLANRVVHFGSDGTDGRDGRDGQSGRPGASQVTSATGAAQTLFLQGGDGENGEDGESGRSPPVVVSPGM